MRFEVFHAKEPNFGMGEPREFPKEYRHVATVSDSTVKTLDDVFRLTNHINKPWQCNVEVTLHLKKPLHRSTSVGDVVVDQDGQRWFCDTFGWKKIA